MQYKVTATGEASIKDRTITGIASVFGVCDLANEIVAPGAFLDTIAHPVTDVKLLFNHDAKNPPVGKVVSLREVGRRELSSQTQRDYPEASGGLEIEYFLLKSERGSEVLEGIKSQAIKSLSIGYTVVSSSVKTINGKQVRVLHKLALHDVSPVNFPANPATLAQKSAVSAETQRLLARLEAAKQGVDYPADSASSLSVRLAEVTQAIFHAHHAQGSAAKLSKDELISRVVRATKAVLTAHIDLDNEDDERPLRTQLLRTKTAWNRLEMLQWL